MFDEARGRSPHGRIAAYAWYALAVLLLIYIVNFIDRQILSILAQDIKHDLNLDDAQLGFLYGTAFAVFYAIFGIPLGRVADTWSRPKLIAIGLCLWSSMTSLSGLSASFAMLAVARIGVGIGEATAAPASYSLISGYFPPERRATALSIYASGLYIGSGLSLPFGGFVLGWWRTTFPDPSAAPLGLSGWQAAFLAAGLPGLLLAVWVWTLREPGQDAPQPEVRSHHEARWRRLAGEFAAVLPPLTLLAVARYTGELRRNLMGLAAIVGATAMLIAVLGDAPQWCSYGLGCYAIMSWVQTLRHRDYATFTLIWGTPTVLALTAAFGSIAFITYSTAFWAPPYALRTFYASPAGPALYFRGMTAAQEVAALIGWSSAAASAVGVIVGGMIADRWRQHHSAGRIYVCMLAILISAPLTVFMFSVQKAAAFFLVSPLAVMVSSSWSGAAVATLQDVVTPRMRATAGATFILGMTMVGLALGPYAVGKIATLTDNLRLGVFALYAVTPITLLALWKASKNIASVEANAAERERVANNES